MKTDLEYPRARFVDLAGIEVLTKDLRDLIERPLKYPHVYAKLGLESPKGILLHGPSGCGKTLLASAIAGEYGIALLRVSAPELIAGMFGESEARIRELFMRAQTSAPCVLFIDEIDAITSRRESATREVERRVIAQLSSCMDAIEAATTPVFIIGATSRPDAIDPALRRAGRFDRELRMVIPDETSRMKILQLVSRSLTLDRDVNMDLLARLTPGYVGADLKALTRESASIAMRRIFDNIENHHQEVDNVAINMSDFMEALKKMQPSAKREGFATCPNVTWEDIGALREVRQELRLAVVEPMRRPELYAALGVNRPCGVLLYGPPGCGKTLLAKAVANESHSNFLSVKGPELLNKYVGESERAIRSLFSRARAAAPCIIFFDELDALCPPRNSESDYASRVVNQLLTEFDGLEGRQGVYVLAATNRPDMIDPAMTRPGRLDRLLFVGLPDSSERLEILQTIGRKLPWGSDIDIRIVAETCEGFSGADLDSLMREAAFSAIKEIIEDDFSVDSPIVHDRHLQEALKKIKPSVLPSSSMK